MSPQTLNIGSLNVRECSAIEGKREVIGRMFDVLALSDTKLGGKMNVS